MLQLTKSEMPDIALYQERLQRNGKIYVYPDKLDGFIKNLKKENEILRRQTSRVLSVNTSRYYSSVDDKNSVFAYLVDYENMNPYLVGNNKANSNKISVVTDKLVNAYENGYAKEFLSHYLPYKSNANLINKMGSFVLKLTDTNEKNVYQQNLKEVTYNVVPSDNLRFNYADYNIIGLNKLWSNIVSAPEGKMLIWGDSEQADFRIANNLVLTNDKNKRYMEKYEDKYEAFARYLADENGEQFDLEKFKSERKMIKESILGAIYNQQTPKDKRAEKILNELKDFLNKKCPKYIEFIKRIDKRDKLGIPYVLETYFGNEIVVTNEKTKSFYSTGYEKSPKNKAVNAPFQSCTSEIIMLTVNSILDKFYSLGYTEDDISVYYVRHDEPIFIASTNIMKDSWIFKDYSDIVIDDWSPLKINFSFGYYYTVEEPKLQKAYEQVSESNEYRFTDLDPSMVKSSENYSPIKDTLCLTVSHIELKDGVSLVIYYNDDEKYFMMEKISTTDEDSIFIKVEDTIRKAADNLIERGYGGVLVYNNLQQKDVYLNGMFTKFLYNNDVSFVDLSESICKYAKERLLKKENPNHEIYFDEKVEIYLDDIVKLQIRRI